MERLTPVPDDELRRATDMFENFGKYREDLGGTKMVAMS